MEMNCEKGERVFLTDNCGQSFFGVVKSVNQELGRLVLSDMVQLPNQKTITGYRNFDKNEIKELKKCTDKEMEDVDVVETPKAVEKPRTMLSDSHLKEIKNLQHMHHYITNFDSSFFSAIAKLKACKKIGLFMKDTSKGRCGRASVIAVSTPSSIFVFDLLTLGDDVFHRGLKEILESPDIVKVVHDCRLLSDCLKHKHVVSLEGVRDVEAEDIMVVCEERRMIRKHTRSLEYLVKVYLGVEMDVPQDLGEQWAERPLPPKGLEALLSAVSFLIPLQEAIQHKHLQRLISASNVYNTFVRNLDFFEFLHQEPRRTLRKQMVSLAAPQAQPRTACARPKPKESPAAELPTVADGHRQSVSSLGPVGPAELPPAGSHEGTGGGQD